MCTAATRNSTARPASPTAPPIRSASSTACCARASRRCWRRATTSRPWRTTALAARPAGARRRARGEHGLAARGRVPARGRPAAPRRSGSPCCATRRTATCRTSSSRDPELLPAENTLTVVPGFIGAYPNAIYRVRRADLPALTRGDPRPRLGGRLPQVRRPLRRAPHRSGVLGRERRDERRVRAVDAARGGALRLQPARKPLIGLPASP